MLINHDQILYNTKQTLEQSRKLKETASSMKRIADNDIANTGTAIAGNWTGDNSAAFLKKYNKLQTKMSRQASQASGVATAISISANNIIKAEEVVLSIIGKK